MNRDQELSAGDVYGGFRIEEVCGRGGMGVVYRATQLSLERTVALKLIAPALAADPEFRHRFRREARLAAAIEHPNVLPVYEAGEAQGRLFLAMRYVEGTDLRALISHQHRLQPRAAVAIVGQVAAGLDAAHAAGLVHRDVKPANVLISGEGEGVHVYLGDFGVAKLATDGFKTTRTGGMGTPDYAAPEQLERGEAEPRSDVYSLGCVLYEALTGRVPFPRPTYAATLLAHLHEPPPRPSLTSGVPAGLDAVVGRAMAKPADERFASAGELAAAARSAIAGDASAPTRRFGRALRWGGALVAAGVALVVALLVLVNGDGDEPRPVVEPSPTAGPSPEERPGATIAERWNVDAGADIVGVATAGDTVIALDALGTVTGYSGDRGAKRWTTRLGGEGVAGPKLVDGRAAVQIRRSSGSSLVVALDPVTGAERWRRRGGPTVRDTLGVGDGVVVLPTEPGDRDAPGRLLDVRDGSTVLDLAPESRLGTEVVEPPLVTDDVVVVPSGSAAPARIVAYSRTDGRVAWERGVEAGLATTALAGGLAIVGTQLGDGDAARAVYQALDPRTGEERWRHEVEGYVGGPPAAAGEHVVFNHGGGAGGLVAVEAATGERAWAMQPNPVAEVTRAGDVLLIASLGLHVHDPADGEELASIDLPPGLNVLAGAQGLAVVGSGRTLAAYSVERERRLREAWRFSDSALVGTGTAAGDLIVVANAEREVVALDRATGEPRWRSPPFRDDGDDASRMQPTVAGDLVLVPAGGDDPEVVALSLADGREIWRVPVEAADNQVDAAQAGDVLVLGGSPFQGVDPATGRVLWRSASALPVRSVFSDRVLASDGRTVIAADGRDLGAFDPATGRARWRAGLPLELYAEELSGVTTQPGAFVAGDEVIVALTTSGAVIDRLQARSLADGRPAWSADLPGGASSVAVGSRIVAALQDQRLLALDPGTGERRWEAAGRDATPGLAIGDGVVASWGVRLFLADAADGRAIDQVHTGLSPLIATPLIAGDRIVVQSEDERTLIAYAY